MHEILFSGVKKIRIQKRTTTEPKDAATTKISKNGAEKHQSSSHRRHKELELSATLIKMWEQFRKHKCSNRAEILQNILITIKGRMKEVSKCVGISVSAIKIPLF